MLSINQPQQVNHPILKSSLIDTKLGPMMAVADETGLYLLEFADQRNLDNEINRLKQKLKANITPGENKIIKNIKYELTNYFNGENYIFNTPTHLLGSLFQKNVWHKLKEIPSGETRSYLEIAKAINASKAYRAVARANATNRLAIIIPCHRVINSNGALSGYAGGIHRKEWLIQHEKP